MANPFPPVLGGIAHNLRYVNYVIMGFMGALPLRSLIHKDLS